MEVVIGLENRGHAMDVGSSPSTPCVSTPSTLSRLSFNDNPSFHSTLASPTRGLTASPFCMGYEPRKTKTSAETDSDSFEFEFGSSRIFEEPLYQYGQQQPGQKKVPEVESLPSMSFADQLFRDGQVLPLKPPPCLQYPSQSSSLPSPAMSPSSILWPFPGLNFKSKDFDPFMVALEKLRKEETSSEHWKASHRGTQYLRRPWKDDTTIETQHQSNTEQGAPDTRWWSRLKRCSSERLAGPTRWIPENQMSSIPLKTPSEATPETDMASTKVAKHWRLFPKGSKRRMIRDLILLRIASAGRADTKHKLRNQNAALKKNNNSRNSSFGTLRG